MLMVMTQNNQPIVEAAGCFAEARFAHFSQEEEESFWGCGVWWGSLQSPQDREDEHQRLQAGF